MFDLRTGDPRDGAGVASVADRFERLAADLRCILAGEGPTTATCPGIRYWRTGASRPSPFKGLHRMGTGHPTLRGGPIWTTEVYARDAVAGLVRTLSRYNRLGARHCGFATHA